MKKQTITKNDQGQIIYSDWEPCTYSADSQNVQMYPNMTIKKFQSVDLIRNSQVVRCTRGIQGSVINSLESYIIAHAQERQRKQILATSEIDSSNFSSLRISKWQSGQSNYDKLAKIVFANAPFESSFSKILSLPFPSEVTEDGEALKCLTVPYYEGTNTSIRLSIHPSDNYCFYQVKNVENVRYKLFIEEISLMTQAIRFTASIGYSLKAQSIFKPCTNNLMQLPSMVYEVYQEPVSAESFWVSKVWRDILTPTKLLIFFANPALIKPKDSSFSDENLDYWKRIDASNVELTFNDKPLYSNSINMFNLTEPHMRYLTLKKLQKNFLCGWKLSEEVTEQLVDGDDYIYPSMLFDFSLYGSPYDLISPVIGSSLREPGNLAIRITFEDSSQVKETVAFFCLFYGDRYNSISTSRGDFINPLIGQ